MSVFALSVLLHHQTKTNKIMKAIINNGKKFGTLNGVLTLNSEIRKLVFKALKENKAKKIIDTEETLMYELGQ